MTRKRGAELDARKLLSELDELISSVKEGAANEAARWPAASARFQASADNLAAYLALRRHDLRSLQEALMALGLSSLGRLESRVLAGLGAVRESLAAIAHAPTGERPSREDFFSGERRLSERSAALFGPRSATRPVAVMVTCPSEAADDPDFFVRLVQREVDAVRINCAHDDRDAWDRMIRHANAAGQAHGRRLRIYMDLAGPKIRTGKVVGAGEHRLRRGDTLAIALSGCAKAAARESGRPAVECTMDSPVRAATTGHRVFYDDGKFGAVVERSTAWGLLARIDTCEGKGVRVKREKGLNFPDTDFAAEAMTKKDLDDLDFVAAHADAIEYSFVQSPEDVVRLQHALAERREDWQRLAVVLKIETQHAIDRLPEILVQAASQQPTAVMIARGDLAVEIGFDRMAEMQEEMLWLAEAAHIPSIWATQVLDHLVSKGTPLRGEMTDAAMAARAECVMLNKGPFICDGLDALSTLLQRMAIHQHKKTPELRPLRSWRRPDETRG